MIALRLDEVAAAVDGRVVGEAATVVQAVDTDSREVDAGCDSLFVALAGEHTDGHRFVDAAFAAGAAAALVDRPEALGAGPGVVVERTWDGIGRLGAAVRDRVDPDVVAVTGSVGKTTTKDLIAAALAPDRPTVAAHGSYNNELGVPLTLLAAREDTAALVVEIGARGVGHISALTPLVRPDVSVVTAVAGAHLEQFGDLATVARAKGELVEALRADGTAVLNADDRLVHAMAGRCDGAVCTYGIDTAADVTATDVRLDELGRPRFRARTPWGDAPVVLPVAGRHNVGNALAALAVAGTLGVPVGTAARGIADAAVSAWRGEVAVSDEGVVVCNDAYNANPTATLAALDLLASLRRDGGRLVAVLGVMAELGDATEEGHARVGRAAAEVADLVVAVGEVRPLAAAVREAGTQLRLVDDAQSALAVLDTWVHPGDVVLVKGSRVAGLEVVAEGLLGRTT